MSDWPFADPPNVVAITVRQIVERQKPILLVSHDEDDGCWQFHTNDGARMEDALVVSLSHVVTIDPSVTQLADLPCGWKAWRDDSSAPWNRCHASDFDNGS